MLRRGRGGSFGSFFQKRTIEKALLFIKNKQKIFPPKGIIFS
jgi:hypothetical protein